MGCKSKLLKANFLNTFVHKNTTEIPMILTANGGHFVFDNVAGSMCLLQFVHLHTCF